MAVCDPEHRRLLLKINFQRISIAAGKGIALRRMEKRRRHSRDRRQAFFSPRKRRYGTQQSPRIRMTGIIENLIHGSNLYYFSRIHDRYPVCDPRYNAKVMCDKDRRRSQFFLNFPKQVQNLCLNRHIQRCRRLISKQNFRIARQRNRQYDPLPHSAGKVIRICLFPLFCLLDSHQLHQFCHSLFHFFFSHVFLMRPHCLCNLRSDCHRRI